MSSSFAGDIGDLARRAWEEVLSTRGRINILVAGRTGVGKSTLVNAVFQGDLAETGQGRPVTREIREYTKEDIPVSIFDTRGLEMDRYQETTDEVVELVRTRGQDPDASRHLHVAWICIAEDSRRVEEGESHLVRQLAALGLPVLGVITRARSDQGFRQEVWRLCPEARQVVRVRALHERDDEGHELRPMGLDTLVDATMEVVPDGVRNALAAAQKVSIEQKQARARMIVGAAAATAAAVGAAPIPFADAALLVPAQLTMLAGITAAFGVPVASGFLVTLLTGAAGAAGATLGGRLLVTNLLKLVPGAGTLAGGVIAAGTASALTAALGEAYIAALTALFRRGGRTPTEAEILEEFRQRLDQSA